MVRYFWIGLAAAFLLSTPAAAQTPLFSHNSELDVTIEAPFATLIRTASRNTDEHPGSLVLNGQSGAERYNLLVSARGMSRRIGGFCTFPPLRIDFENNQLRETLFRGQNKLKLTTHCRPSANYEQLYVLEYLAYRLYNEITPLSFRARPLRVTYHDTENRRDDETHFGFFVEDEDDLARRNDRVALEVETRTVTIDQLDGAAAARVALFEFMIGNLDFDMLQSAAGRDCCHNTRLLAPSETNRTAIVPAPYDFDHSGFVNAPYALPPEGLSVRNVRQRLYRGYCAHNDQLPAAIALFQSRREALNALIAGATRLSQSRRQTARNYIDGFFDVIGDPQAVQRQLIERCR
jgi:hypothetical protein